MKLWFTADTHWGSTRTLELSKRPFDSVEQMDKQIINNWNSVVTMEDTVYHLGDVGELHRLYELNAKHIKLVLGNYETDNFDNIKELSNQLDDRVDIIKFDLKNNSYKLATYVNIDNIKFALVHKPADSLPGDFYLFGHIHKLQMVKKVGLNVGIDCHNFYPIDTETIMFYYNAIMNHYDENVFMD